MKVEGYFFGIIGVFGAVVAAIYWVLSEDPTGSIALLLTGGLGAMIAAYLLVTARRMEPRPEDLGDADVTAGAGEVGHFSPGSYWPIAIGLFAAIAPLGFVFGIWLTLIFGVLLLAAITGLVFEHFAGQQ